MYLPTSEKCPEELEQEVVFFLYNQNNNNSGISLSAIYNK